jgi:predicted S18 family serine protease
MSATSWGRFFGMPGKTVPLDKEYLQRACLAKLSEADERINYVRLYVPSIVGDSEQMLEDARSYSLTEPIMCIFTASKAKAQANLLANAISINRQNVDALLQQKIQADNVILEKQQEKGFFPILGYSYTQYAADLRADQPYSALTFSEYALELSNLDIYFSQEKTFYIPTPVLDEIAIFGFGALFGAAVVMLILGRRKKRRR